MTTPTPPASGFPEPLRPFQMQPLRSPRPRPKRPRPHRTHVVPSVLSRASAPALKEETDMPHHAYAVLGGPREPVRREGWNPGPP